jgi:hypothetical protein
MGGRVYHNRDKLNCIKALLTKIEASNAEIDNEALHSDNRRPAECCDLPSCHC